MNVALIGVTDGVGQRLSAELLRRGHHVTAISAPGLVPEAENIAAEAGTSTSPRRWPRCCGEHDVVVSCVEFANYDHENLIRAAHDRAVPRYLIYGGSGTLLAPGMTTRLMDTPTFPADYRPPAVAAATFFDRLREESDLDWTSISPPPGFMLGKRTGTFCVGVDEVLIGPDGKPSISNESLIAAVDELEQPKHRGRRFNVGY